MKKILIVEDEKEMLNFLRDHLSRSGLHVETAADGKDAIEKVKAFIPDLVLLDIIIPKLNGLEVLKWIKKNQPQTFVILTTAKEELQDLKNGYALQADYYITKPYTIEEIFKGINIMSALKNNDAN